MLKRWGKYTAAADWARISCVTTGDEDAALARRPPDTIRQAILSGRFRTLESGWATYSLASRLLFNTVQIAMSQTSPTTLRIASKLSERSSIQSMWQPALQPAAALFAAGMIGLGLLALFYGDFALVWQPVAPWVPGRTVLAYASGSVMLLGGVGLLIRATAAWSTRLLFPYLVVWALLKVPALVVAPKIEGVWLGFGELVVLLAGGWVLLARLGGVREDSWLAFAGGERGIRIAKYLFAIWIIPVGLSHFFYTKATIDLIPAWMPARMFWAYLTGAGHIAAGLGVLFSVLPRAALFAEAAMLSVITLLVWAPAVLGHPTARMPWTAFWISWAITAAVWVLAQGMKKQGPGIRE